MEITKLQLSEINPAHYNPRKDLQPGDKEYEDLKRSLGHFDLQVPLIVNVRDGKNVLVSGHQRLKILLDLGYESTEAVTVDLPADEEKALNIAMNKIKGDWDVTKLKDLLGEIRAQVEDIRITGFDDVEINKLNFDYELPEEEREYDESVADDVKTITCPGCDYEFPI